MIRKSRNSAQSAPPCQTLVKATPQDGKKKKSSKEKIKEEVKTMSVGALKKELKARNISTDGMLEKEDLVNAVVKARHQEHKENKKSKEASKSTSIVSAKQPEKPKKTAPSSSTNNKSKPGISRKTEGKTAKTAAQQNRAKVDDKFQEGEFIDPTRWRFDEKQFHGSAVYISIGKEESVRGEPILEAVKKVKQNPDKYVAIFYQTDMLKRAVAKQKYSLVYREGTNGYYPDDLDPNGPFTIVHVRYERCKPFPNNELPMEFRDKYTDTMTYYGKPLHQHNKPILPGRGMGVGDAPNLKIIGDVDPSDVNQGSVGNCWLLSAISALAEFDGAVKRLFRKTPNLELMPMDKPNQYIVSLYDVSTWKEVDVVIDERLCTHPNGQLLGARPSEDGELWVCYLEKALAAHCGGWDKIKGGQCTHGWAMLTGCKHQYTIRKNPNTGKYVCNLKFNPMMNQWLRLANNPKECEKGTYPNPWPEVGGGGNGEITQEELFMKMCAWDDENYIVGASIGGETDKTRSDGLVSNHAYSVIEAHNDVAGTDIDLLKIRNPWGKGEIKDGEFDDDGPGWDKYPQVKAALNPVEADDGIFYLTKQEFFHFFTTIYLSASNMTEFLED